jgi:hypothetical protein
VTKKSFMTPSTLTTILNTAPMILQGAGKLIKMIRERKEEEQPGEQHDIPVTVEGLKQEIQRIETRLAATDEANVEQVRLIEQLARQNEALATSLSRTLKRLNILALVAVIALLDAIGAVLLSLQ